jgi:hypothetical protein
LWVESERDELRCDVEKRSGKPVVTGENFKGLAGKGKKIDNVMQDKFL